MRISNGNVSSCIGMMFTLALFSNAASEKAQAARINEIRIDQPSSDTDEYYELFGTPGESLDTLTYLVIGDVSSNSGVIEAVIGLSGQTIPADGFFLAAENGSAFGAIADLDAGSSGLNFENSDNVAHLLVDGFSGSNGDDLDTNDDGMLDAMPWTSIVDGISLIEEPNPPTGTEFDYSANLGIDALGPDGSNVPGHAFRLPNGGAWQIGQFDPAGGMDTPGLSNGVIPEPSSVLLMLLATAAIFAMRKAQ